MVLMMRTMVCYFEIIIFFFGRLIRNSHIPTWTMSKPFNPFLRGDRTPSRPKAIGIVRLLIRIYSVVYRNHQNWMPTIKFMWMFCQCPILMNFENFSFMSILTPNMLQMGGKDLYTCSVKGKFSHFILLYMLLYYHNLNCVHVNFRCRIYLEAKLRLTCWPRLEVLASTH